MNIILIYLVTELLIILGLASLGSDFPYVALYVLWAFCGLAISFWQHKKKPIPYLYIIANIVFVILTVKAILPFFIGQLKSDMVTALVQTWIYFLLISTFIIYTKRDFYLIQGLCLGLVIYACFYPTNKPLVLLIQILGFLAVWIIALRMINILPENNEQKNVFSRAKDIYREIKLETVLFLVVLIVSLPFYFLIPRLSIPSLPLNELLAQRYSTVYADFPQRGLVSFLSKKTAEPAPFSQQKGSVEKLLQPKPKPSKPIFWHNQEEISKLEEKISQINRQLLQLGLENQLPEIEKEIRQRQRLLERREKLLRNKEALGNVLDEAKKEYLELAQTSLETTPQLPGKIAYVEKKIQLMINNRSALERLLKKISEQLDGIRTLVYQQSRLSRQAIRILWDQKEELENELKILKTTPYPIPEEKPATEKSTEAPIKKPTRNITVLDILLYILILLLLFYIVGYAVAFILPFLKQKKRFQQAARQGEHNLVVSLVYNFLARLLSIFGFPYPIKILPEDYQKIINQRFDIIAADIQDLTMLFIEARYSAHRFQILEQEKALDCYRAVFQKLQTQGVFWQKLLLKLSFLFRL